MSFYENGRSTALVTLGFIKRANALVHVPGLGAGGRGGLSPETKMRLLSALTGTAGGAIGGALVDSEDRGRGALIGGGLSGAMHGLSKGVGHYANKKIPGMADLQDAYARNILKNPGQLAGLSAGGGLMGGAMGAGIGNLIRGNEPAA